MVRPTLTIFFTQQLQLAFHSVILTTRYQTYSFRIGAATTAAACGFSELQIQTMARSKSAAFKKYIRIPTLQV